MPPKKGSFFKDGRETALHSYIFNSPSLSTFRNNPAALLGAINDYATTQSRMMIFQQGKLEVSRQILESMNPRPKVLIELGTYVGNSAVAWGAMLRDLNQGSSEGCKVYSLELETDFISIAQDFVSLAGLESIVEVIEGPAAESLAKLAQDRRLGGGAVDVLFIDHWERFYLPDLQTCEKLGLLRKGSVVIADNTDMPGAPDYLEYVQKGGDHGENGVKYESQTYETTGAKGHPNLLEVSTVV